MVRVINLETGGVYEFSNEDLADTFCAEWCVENPGWESGIDRDGDRVLMLVGEGD
jgi:hypothetical protein